MATIDETIEWKDTTRIDDVISTLSQIKNKHGNIKVTLQYQDERQAFKGHTQSVYAYYVENEDGGEPIVILE